jgi:rhodanese-related sulfurtransferase
MKTLFTYGFLVMSCFGYLGCALQPEPMAGVVAVDAKQSAELLEKNPAAVVLDIRTPSEFKTGRIAGAKNIDFNAADFTRKLAALDPTKAYLIHCRSGRRSDQSLKTFCKLNFQSIYHLEGGINEWKRAGLPLEKP